MGKLAQGRAVCLLRWKAQMKGRADRALLRVRVHALDPEAQVGVQDKAAVEDHGHLHHSLETATFHVVVRAQNLARVRQPALIAIGLAVAVYLQIECRWIHSNKSDYMALEYHNGKRSMALEACVAIPASQRPHNESR